MKKDTNKYIPKYYGYIRLSNKTNGDISFENQKREIMQYADNKNLFISKIFIDEAKPKNMNRKEELQKVLSLLKNGDTLLYYTISRITKSLDEYGEICRNLEKNKKKLCTLYSIKENMENRGAVHLLFANVLIGSYLYRSDEKKRVLLCKENIKRGVIFSSSENIQIEKCIELCQNNGIVYTESEDLKNTLISDPGTIIVYSISNLGANQD